MRITATSTLLASTPRGLRTAARPLSTSALSRFHTTPSPRATNPPASLPDLSLRKAQSVNNKWRGTSTNGSSTKNYVGGEFLESSTDSWVDVHDPATQFVLSRVPETTADEFQQAVEAAEKAQPEWSEMSLLGRQQVMFR